MITPKDHPYHQLFREPVGQTQSNRSLLQHAMVS